MGMLNKIFKPRNERILKSYFKTVDKINAIEPEFEALSDEQLKAKTAEFKAAIEAGKSVDDILIEAFATVREASRRVLGMRHFDVQLVGGMILHYGMIAEMRTGEGKTLVATLPCYLNALEGKGVHVVTVNDYLATRDSGWMGKVHEFLGLSIGCITSDMESDERRAAYACDITYATNNELGFDYLRDNMRFTKSEMVQRGHFFAVIDEVDSILIDEARTPLIISGPAERSTGLYTQIDAIIPKLREEHYEKDEKGRNISLTEEGTNRVEELLVRAKVIKEAGNLYDMENLIKMHHIDQALKAHHLFEKDKDYIIEEQEVVLIDEFTGRKMFGRRYSDGLHQAIEAKEGVPIKKENQTLASVTFQNYFRMYEHLSGMTGTALTEANELMDIYELDVLAVPTNVPVARIDDEDDIYANAKEKYDAIIKKIKEAHKKGQPVLAGTASIEQSEYLSKLLKEAKLKHNVLNARHHDKEADIIEQAGRIGAITVATNMAGRGTDIKLGGNVEAELEKADNDNQRKKIKDTFEKEKKKVLEAGGLCVIGTERHESRRIDNQLRGRSGRQGDPGYSKFYLSTEDDLIRVFGADKKMNWVMTKMGEPGEPITHSLITKLMEKSQKKVEARNYEIRKNLLKFDDVMNDQRNVIYEMRTDIMGANDVKQPTEDIRKEITENIISFHIPKGAYPEQWDTEGLHTKLQATFGLDLPVKDWANEEGVADEEILDRVEAQVNELFDNKEKLYGADIMRDMEKRLFLFTLDEEWKNHLHFLDGLRASINLRAYGQKDPLNEYKKEAFSAFNTCLDKIEEQYLTRLAHARVEGAEDMELDFLNDDGLDQAIADQPLLKGEAPERESVETFRYKTPDAQFDPNNPDTWGKVGRNDPCPCGSGKKYKQCHGKI